MKEENKKNNYFFIICFFVCIFLYLLFLYARNVETKMLAVKEYKVESEDLPTYFSGLKIVHFSDIYYDNSVDLEYLEKMVDKINVLNPDLIFFTGDLIRKGKKMNEKSIEKISKILKKIDSTLGKYAIKGNLDYNNEYENIMLKSDFSILENKYELIYKEGLNPIFVCGLGSYIKGKVNLDGCYDFYISSQDIENTPKFKIFLIHEGNIIDDLLLKDSEVSLILGGNSLNGIVNIPFYGGIFTLKGSEKYYEPEYIVDNTRIFISSGIGTDEKRIRLFNKPSFNFYRLKSLQ